MTIAAVVLPEGFAIREDESDTSCAACYRRTGETLAVAKNADGDEWCPRCDGEVAQ